jgi:hypothetical protein
MELAKVILSVIVWSPLMIIPILIISTIVMAITNIIRTS